MSFSAEVIPPVRRIILYLQYLIVNEEGPEQPCMKGLLLLLLLLSFNRIKMSNI